MAWIKCNGKTWESNPSNRLFVCCHDIGKMRMLPPNDAIKDLKKFGISYGVGKEFLCTHGTKHKITSNSSLETICEHWED